MQIHCRFHYHMEYVDTLLSGNIVPLDSRDHKWGIFVPKYFKLKNFRIIIFQVHPNNAKIIYCLFFFNWAKFSEMVHSKLFTTYFNLLFFDHLTFRCGTWVASYSVILLVILLKYAHLCSLETALFLPQLLWTKLPEWVHPLESPLYVGFISWG